MARKRKKNLGPLIEELMEEYNIPTKKDFERLNDKLTELENLLKQIALTSSYGGGKIGSEKKSGKKVTAAEMVFNIVKKEKNPVDFKMLKDKTGFDDKKLRNIIFRLHATKKNKKSGKRVLYTCRRKRWRQV
jgi:hypothetical protein